jgi:predicted nucleic acid-binding Zn ribbon protein
VNRPPQDRPPRRRRSRPGVDPGPSRLGDGLDEAVARLAPPDAGSAPASAGSLSAVFTRWEEIVGPGLARHVRPLRLSGGVLVVAVDHPAWATQVRSLGASLLGRVGEVSGQVPDRLEVTVRPPPTGPQTRSDGGGVE